MTVPNPAHPKVRDAFLTDTGARVTMATVGPTMTTVHHPIDGEYFVRRSVVATWTPAPPPLITEDVTLCREGDYGPWTSSLDYWPLIGDRSLVIHPNGTWTEVPA